MHTLPTSWVSIPFERGAASRGPVHDGLIDGIAIYAEDFNGIHCIGAEGGNTFVVSEDADGTPDALVLYVIRQGYPREPEIVYYGRDAKDLSDWISNNGGCPLPTLLLSSRGFAPTYAVHTYAVIRIKTIGDAPDHGESIQKFAERVSDAVAASLNHIDVRGVSPAGCDVEQIEYAEEISAVLVDEITPDEVDPSGEQTTEYWFDDRMEPNNGNGTDPARYARLLKLVESIAVTPLHGEACDDAPGGIQAWTDTEHVYERLEEIVTQCRAAIAKPEKETPRESEHR